MNRVIDLSYADDLVYGLIQGLTEFLPVSSSGHLALLPHFLNIQDPGVFFDLTMHVGTGMAVALYFWKDLKKIFKESVRIFTPRSNWKRKKKDCLESLWTFHMMIATFSTFFLILLIKDFAKEFGRSSDLICYNLMVFGVLMILADYLGGIWERRRSHKSQNKLQMESQNSLTKAFFIGAFQAIAIFPGVSRSGITLTISRLLGLSRIEATRFSFLLSLPIIFGGFVFKLREIPPGMKIDVFDCLLGGVVSFAVGLLTIHFFLKVIQKMGLWPFALYRFILAIILLKTL